jgi:hypothetical protein
LKRLFEVVAIMRTFSCQVNPYPAAALAWSDHFQGDLGRPVAARLGAARLNVSEYQPAVGGEIDPEIRN